MKKIILLTGSLMPVLFSLAQLPDTDIFVADMKWSKDSTYFGTPVNITHRQGYDNHPCFASNGASLYYVGADSNQCDVKRYLFASKISAVVTRSRESEFSPGMAPGGHLMTVVRIDADSSQHAYTFPPGNPRHPTLIYGTDSIGYYCWMNDSLLAMFIVGTPHSLQILNRARIQRTKITENIGRCLKLNADSTHLYYVSKHSETDWRIHTLSVKDFKIAEVARTLPGVEDFAVLKDGTLLMGDQGILYALKAPKKKWKKVADFSASVGNFYRIAVSPQENKMAMVGYADKRP